MITLNRYWTSITAIGILCTFPELFIYGTLYGGLIFALCVITAGYVDEFIGSNREQDKASNDK